VFAALGCALAIAACGSSDPTNSTGSSRLTGQSKLAGAFAFAKCMRSHGVSDFPDPQVTGNRIQILGANSGINDRSPAFQSAQTSCKHLLPGGGPGSAHPSAQDKAQMLRLSQCMRQHGITGFPDPTLTPPSNPADYSGVLDRNGVVLAIPSSMNTRSPAFKQAATACNFDPAQ
jgi:hypothetical protein